MIKILKNHDVNRKNLLTNNNSSTINTIATTNHTILGDVIRLLQMLYNNNLEFENLALKKYVKTINVVQNIDTHFII